MGSIWCAISWTASFNPYAVIVMECNEEELFQGIRSIVWLKEAVIGIDEMAFPVVGRRWN